MNRLFWFLVFLSPGFYGKSQISIYVSFQEKPIPFAKVVYHSAMDTNKRIILTDLNGIAKIPKFPQSTQFYLHISFMGYHPIEDTIPSNSEKHYQFVPYGKITNEVFVTGEIGATSVNQAVNRITVIKQEDIVNSGASTLNEILGYQTNIRINQDNILGSGISMGGMSGENVKILQDGVPVIGRLDGNIDLSQINLDNVERIEIVNGPLSVNYGTNALAGTINIITKKYQPPGWNGNVFSYYESTGNYNLTSNLAWRHKKHTLKLSGGRKYFDGWDENQPFILFPKETLADTNRALQWNPKLQYFGEAQYLLQIKQWQINPFFRYYQEKITNRGFPLKPYLETAFDDYYYTWRIDQGANIDRTTKKGQFKAILAYNRFKRIKNTWYKDLTTLNQVLSPNASDQDTSIFDLKMARISYSSKSDTWFNFQIGTDINVESSIGKRIKDQTQTIGDYAGYASAQMAFLNKKLTVKPGLRYAYNTSFTSPVIPSLNLKYELKNVQIRGSVAQGFRSPTLKELYFYFVDINHDIHGNLNLIPETSFNIYGSITWLKAIKTKNLLKTEVSGFYNDFENLITLGLMPDGSYTYINIGEFSTVGTQTQVSFRGKQFKGQFNVAYIGRYNAEQSEILPTYNFSPEISSTLSYRLLSQFSFNLFYKYNGRLLSYSIDQNDHIFTNETSGFHIMDLSFSQKWFNDKLIIVTGIKNLLDVTNINMIGLSSGGAHNSGGNLAAGRGRSIFLSINYKFKYNKNTLP